MLTDEELFTLAPDLQPRLEILGGKVPVLFIDDIYRFPDALRERALQQHFTPAPYLYPGRVTGVPRTMPTVDRVCRWIIDRVNNDYLPHVPILSDGQPVNTLRIAHVDFAVVDTHPDDLDPAQKVPHVDPVPVFALIYLNREDRGGTVFYEQIADGCSKEADGYPTASEEGFRVTAHIEPRFNRLVIYPGFVPHSGDITGDWIRTEARFKNPRLTQRFAFAP